MLEKMSKDRWASLCKEPGKPCDSVSLLTIEKGTIVHAKTESNTSYLLEMLDPDQQLVQFIRIKSPAPGRRGTCRIPSTIRKGGTIRFGDSQKESSRINHLAVIEPQL